MKKKEIFRDWPELMSKDKDRKSTPCKFGLLVDGLSCYCHADTEEAPLECPVWRKHGVENSSRWKKGNWKDDSCPFFEKE